LERLLANRWRHAFNGTRRDAGECHTENNERVMRCQYDTAVSLERSRGANKVTGTVLFLAAFLACAVEAVEATTVVLAVGVTRGWRSPIRGVGVALLVLAAIVAALGPTIASIPLSPLRLVVGALLLIFGLGWLRKAVLRASGFKALHDEDALYAQEVAAAQAAGAAPSKGVMGGDPYSFTLSFKAVLLEGLEVAFIVVTFGANAKNVALAASAAAAAVMVVVVAAVAVRGPLSKVPENSIKFAVGVLLASFGTFWGAEGAGAHWPGGDAALLGIIPAVAGGGLALVAAMRRRRAQPARNAALGEAS
jgi:uncharacterized membrane protein